jgi:phenylpyruvate tautomerase
MPLIKVQTSVTVDAAQTDRLLKQLSTSLAKHTGKPESYVMTLLEAGTPMTFGGTPNPACYVEIKNVGALSPALTKTMSQDFCQQVNQVLKIDPDRVYIEFSDVKGAMWGWNGSTFG